MEGRREGEGKWRPLRGPAEGRRRVGVKGGRGHFKDSAGPFKAERGGRIDLSHPSDVGDVDTERF